MVNRGTNGIQTDADGISLVDVALLLGENFRALIFLPLFAGVVALLIAFLIPPTFTATTTLLPPQQQQSLATVLATQLGAIAGQATAASGIKNPADTYVAMLKSRTVADTLIERFQLKQRYQVDLNEDARRELESLTHIATGRDGLIVVSVDDRDPNQASDMANGYVDALLSLTQTLAVSEASQRRLFFERQLKQSREDLTRAEVALRGAGINEATLNTVPESALEFVANLKAKVTAQEIKLAALRGYMTESNPDFKQAQNELAALKMQLQKTEQNDASKIRGRGAEYIARLRDFKYHETLFELMAKQYELARLDEAREGAMIQVVDRAVPPELKSRPKKAQIAVVSTVLTFFLTLIWVLLRHGLQNDVVDPEQSEKLHRLRRLFSLRGR